MKSFERVMKKVHDRQNKPVHTVVRYNYTIEQSREFVFNLASKEKTVSFEKIFEECNDRIHAIFLFLSLLELIQLHFMQIIVGEGRNNFKVEWNENRQETDTFENPSFDPILN